MDRADIIAHAVVSVVTIIGLIILGTTKVVTGEAVVVALLACGGVVGTLSASDKMVYGKKSVNSKTAYRHNRDGVEVIDIEDGL